MTESEWLEQRKTCIGASEAAAILGESDWQSPYSVWANKVFDIDTVMDSERMKWGKNLEPIIAAEFEHWAEENIPKYAMIIGDGNVLHRSNKHDFIGASPDRLVLDDNRMIGILEIKTTDGRNAKEWEDGIPLAYQIQVQQQLYVTGLSRAWLAVLIGGNAFKVYPVERNQKFIDVMVATEVEFWNEYVLTKTPPPVDGHKATSKAIALLHPDDSGAEIVLDDFLDAPEELQALKEKRKEIDGQIDVIENRLKSVIGEATFAQCGAYRLSYKTQTRAAHEVKESKYRVLRMVKPKQQ